MKNWNIYFPRYTNANVSVDADFRGNWFPEEAKDYSDKAHSLSGFIVSHWDI